MTPARQLTAFRYMTRYRCVGGTCEDTCCSGWQIEADRDRFNRLKRAMSGSELEKEEFARAHEVLRGPNRTPARHALLVLNEGGDCAFLDGERACSAQARYGEEVLSNTCATFPRALAQIGTRLELSGSPSCPEVARQLLLHDDALELDKVDDVGRLVLARKIGDRDLPPYAKHHDAIRAFVCDLLSLPYPLLTRLFFVAYFANESSAVLRRGAARVDDAKLEAIMARLDHAEIQRELHTGFNALSVRDDVSLPLVLQLLELRARTTGSFRERVAGVLSAYVPSETPASPKREVSFDDVMRGYRSAAAAWQDEPYAARIEGYFTRYAKSYWLKEWYVDSPDLMAHTQSLVLRLAIFRFLLFGHAKLTASISGSVDERLAALDEAVVDVVQKFSRHFEHSKAFMKSIERELEDKGMRTLAHTITLIRF